MDSAPREKEKKLPPRVLLSNFEVYQFLQQRQKAEQKWVEEEYHNLHTVQFEVLRYLHRSPCKYQSDDQVKDFLEAMKPYNLTKAEQLMLLNLRPMAEVDLYLAIEEVMERFTDEEREKLLEDVARTLPLPDAMET